MTEAQQKIGEEIIRFMRGKYALDEVGDEKGWQGMPGLRFRRGGKRY